MKSSFTKFLRWFYWYRNQLKWRVRNWRYYYLTKHVCWMCRTPFQCNNRRYTM